MKLRARSTWDPSVGQGLGIKAGDGLLVLKIDQEAREPIAKELKTLAKRQHDLFLKALDKWSQTPPEQRGAKPAYQDTLVELDLALTIHYRKRSIDANNLYWKLLEIEANYLNGTPLYRDGYWSKKLPGQIITPEEIHQDELETYCLKLELYFPQEVVGDAVCGIESEVGRVKDKQPIGDGKTWKLTVWKTTSYLDTKEFHDWVQRVIDRIRDGGLLATDVPEFIQLKQDFVDILKGNKKEESRK